MTRLGHALHTLRLVTLWLLVAPGCGGDDAAPGGGGPPVGLAVIGSDYKSVSVPLADPATGAIVHDGCLTSGSAMPGLTTALSGDVVLPSAPQPRHELVLIDRSNATLTWADPSDCQVLGQLNVGEGMAANPHDLITVSASKAYLTRYAPSASDLLVIDPTARAILGRLDLRSLSTRPDGDHPVQPMPDRGLVVGSKVYVVLNELTADFKEAGAARLAVIDSASDVISTIELPSLQNCGSLARLDGALAVGCAGVFAAGPSQIEASGIALVDLSATPPAVTVVPATGFGAPVSGADLVVLSRSAAFTVVPGDFTSMRPDALWAFDFDGGAPHKVLDGSGPFTLGGLVAQPGTRTLFIGDAADEGPRILVVDATDAAAPAQKPPVPVNGLPPRALAFY